MQLRYMQIYKALGYDLLHPSAKNARNLEKLHRVSPITKQDGFDFIGLSELDAPNFEEAQTMPLQLFNDCLYCGIPELHEEDNSRQKNRLQIEKCKGGTNES